MRRPTPMARGADKLCVVVGRRSYITSIGTRACAGCVSASDQEPDLTGMAEIPVRRHARVRRLLVRLVWIAWAIGIVATALGFTAAWLPAFDLINQARPLHALVALALFVAAVASREPPLIRPTAALALLQIGLLLLPWARAAASAPGAPPALRLVTFDLGGAGVRFD